MSLFDYTGDSAMLRLNTSFNADTYKGRFAARFDYRYSGKVCYAVESMPGVWAVTPFPGLTVHDIDLMRDAKHVFTGNNSYVVDTALGGALSAAGYTVTS